MFKYKSASELEAMTEEQRNTYLEQKTAHEEAQTKEAVDKAVTEAVDKATEEQNKVISKLEETVNALKEKGHKIDEESKTILAVVKEKADALKAMKEAIAKGDNPKGIDFTIKGTQGAVDIVGRDELIPVEAGVERKPIRRTSILDLFAVDFVGSEMLKYREEDVVTRDAKFVVACAPSVHLTKKTWIIRTIELAKIRDMVDICIDMLEDYDFVESEIRTLLNESIQLTKESELLTGASAAPTDLASIASIASEFNPANPLAPFDGVSGNGFTLANIEQLGDAMAGQISVFGELNKWMADTFIMNHSDFIRYRNLKDANGNKLIHTLSDDVATIAGMRVITNPIVAANTCYVLDSTKGRIKQRKGYTVGMYFENKDNAEHELVTLKGLERLQFYVRNINKDAFMKCSDINAAITAITQ